MITRITLKNHILKLLLLWAGYFLLTLALTWPTASQVATHLPGDGGDDPAIAWNLWWVKYALLNQAQNPFDTDFLFYPIGINLAFYTLTPLNAAIALPLTLNLGVVTASNLHMFFSFVVGGYGAFLLVRYLLATLPPKVEPALFRPDPSLIWLSAAVAGGFFAFASSKLFYVALGQFNIASTHWVPLAALYMIRSHRRPGQLKNPLMAALFLSLQAWTEMTYASFLLILLGLLWLYWGLRFGFGHLKSQDRSTVLWPAAALQLRAGLVLLVTFLLGVAPLLAQMLPDMRIEGDFLVESGGFADAFSADLFGFIVPTMHHPFLGALIHQTYIAGFDKGQHIYLGLTLLSLTFIALITGYRRPELGFWFISAAIFALLCLGPIIVVNGYVTELNGPFVLLQKLPFFKGNRYPSRYSVMLVLSLCVVAGYGLVRLGQWVGPQSHALNRLKSNLALLVVAGLFLFEHLSLPLPQSDMRVPAAYDLIAADPNDVTVLDIPFAWRNGFRITGALTTQFMFGQFYQTLHQKRLLQGNTSRNPLFKFQYFTNAPIINSLLALETGRTIQQERWSQDRAIAADVLRFLNIHYIVVRPEPDNPLVTSQATIPYIEALLPVKKVHDEPSIKVYQVSPLPSPPSPIRIDSSQPLASLYFAEGWGLLTPGQPMIAQREEVRLLAPLIKAPQQIRLRLRLPEPATANSQRVYLELNGWRSEPQSLGPAWQELSFEIPAGPIQPGLNDLRLHFDNVVSLPFPGPETAILDVTVVSAGEEVGGFGHIYVNGYQVSPNERGYNVAIIQPGRPVVVDYFDTHYYPAASAALGHYEPLTVRGAGMIIAVAAADEASAQLDGEAISALHSIGAKEDLRGCFRCSHALISEVGRPDGKTVEALDPLRPVGVTLNLGLTEPTIAAVVDWIQVEPK